MLCYRQGDVLIVRLEEEPAAAVAVPRQEGGRVVVAHGEATGHAHVVVGGEAELVTATQADELYLLVHGDAELVHDEHDPIVIAPGSYRIVRQREYVPPQDAGSALGSLTDDEYYRYVLD